MATAKSLTPQQIQNADLPRSLRGFDAESTRAFLARAADALTSVTRERDDLRRRLDEVSEQASQVPTDAETIGAVLLTAKRAADDLIARAEEEANAIRAGAEQLRSDAENQRDNLLDQARDRAEALVREAVGTVDALGRDADELRRLISAHRQEFIAFLRSALEQLDGVEALRPPAAPAALDGELLAQLPSE